MQLKLFLFYTAGIGHLCAMTVGILRMRMWCVSSSVTQALLLPKLASITSIAAEENG